MKFKKPSGKKTTDTVAQVVGVIVGMKASKGVATLIPVQNELAKKGIIAGAGLAAALCLTGDDLVSKIVQAVGVGMIVQQGSDAIDTAVQGSLPAATSSGTKAINAAFGNGGAAYIAPATSVTSRSYASTSRNGEMAMGRARKRLGNPDFRMGNPAQGMFQAG